MRLALLNGLQKGGIFILRAAECRRDRVPEGRAVTTDSHDLVAVGIIAVQNLAHTGEGFHARIQIGRNKRQRSGRFAIRMVGDAWCVVAGFHRLQQRKQSGGGLRRRKQRVCALLGDAVKRCGHRADRIGASEQRFKRFLWCNERIKLVLRWNGFIRKAGEKNARPVVARGDAADAVHNRTGWLQQ
ncbi:hypothetical protein SDC9_118394 [bioreactor metagenome]|uniref:Uncharacterized protein n=1 Tax=bioreactor metagenome TaxID=1076179 RepID=A0A645C1B9_9ZZZZ